MDHELERGPDVPESMIQSVGFLFLALVIETIMNGFFFGAHVPGSLFQGIIIAGLASVVNVLIIGYVLALLWRLKNYRNDLRKGASAVGVCIVVVVAVALNLFVAHYRDALSADYPAQGEECSLGEDADPNAEATCLLLESTFDLQGFESYMLFLLGLGFCGFGAWKFYHMDDAYPGYGRLEQKRRNTDEDVRAKRREILERIKDRWNVLRRARQNSFDDPVERWNRAEVAVRERTRLHEEFKNYVRELEESCRGAIEIYRTANRQERLSQPCPEHWESLWHADWKLPGALKPVIICPRNVAEKRRALAEAALRKQLNEIDACFKKCKSLVETMTRLRHA